MKPLDRLHDPERRRFQIIYADPPWKYEFTAFHKRNANRESTPQGRASDHYKTMSVEELEAMGPTVEALARKHAALFLWTTWPKLFDAERVAKAWGFRYVTIGFLWVKTGPSWHPEQLAMFHPTLEKFMTCGMGYHARANTEPCLFFKRGHPGIFESRVIPQVVFEPGREHSRKPDEVRRRIELAYPRRSYLELFARETAPGWEAMGHEVGKFGAVAREESE